jgi:prepilin-type N-terminal cleavage/methylation domain-containing protein
MMTMKPEPVGADDRGFTLVEMIIVMLIIGVLAAIAIPLVIDQRGKAHDTVARHDARRLGLAVASYFQEFTPAPGVQIAGGRFVVGADDVGTVSPGVVVAGASSTVVDTTGWTQAAWCFALKDPDGVTKTFRFSAQQGLEAGACTSTTAP